MLIRPTFTRGRDEKDKSANDDLAARWSDVCLHGNGQRNQPRVGSGGGVFAAGGESGLGFVRSPSRKVAHARTREPERTVALAARARNRRCRARRQLGTFQGSRLLAR